VPLLIQSLPLSLKTFWRYLALLPFLAFFAILIAFFGGFIPLFNYLVPGTISAFFIIMGLRCALAARGHENAPDYSTLLRSSVVFCILNIVAHEAISLSINGGAFALKAGYHVATGGDPALAWPTFDLYWLVTTALLVVAYAVYASAIAVPMTAAAASGTRKGPDRGIFFGLGTAWVSLTAIMVVWLWVGGIFTIFGEVWLLFAMIASSVIALASGTEVPWSWSLDRTTLMGRTLFMTWASAWFYATAVLAWEVADKKRAKAQVASQGASRVSGDSLRALREERARMQRGEVS
jgi:hypothetical protein